MFRSRIKHVVSATMVFWIGFNVGSFWQLFKTLCTGILVVFRNTSFLRSSHPNSDCFRNTSNASGQSFQFLAISSGLPSVEKFGRGLWLTWRRCGISALVVTAVVIFRSFPTLLEVVSFFVTICVALINPHTHTQSARVRVCSSVFVANFITLDG